MLQRAIYFPHWWLWNGNIIFNPCCSFGLVVSWILRKLPCLKFSSQLNRPPPILLTPHARYKIMTFFCVPKFSSNLFVFYSFFSKVIFFGIEFRLSNFFHFYFLEYRPNVDKRKYNPLQGFIFKFTMLWKFIAIFSLFSIFKLLVRAHCWSVGNAVVWR